ncbi:MULTISPECIES: SNU13 family protein [Streptomyces]|uniref:SNU13 family protein n=1 Tax=Streptomyces albidocamelliae TaxID=2981135 RepID=A0ABY6F112_9ACTN|nr:SNU13 family protein [Streptomyces sp. HUAS 14-6]UXY40366.1 SNU13 family protein [Streptomyces sp. HUAS 14-6]
MPLGQESSLGIAEYVMAADADPPHIVLTRVQFY